MCVCAGIAGGFREFYRIYEWQRIVGFRILGMGCSGLRLRLSVE